MIRHLWTRLARLYEFPSRPEILGTGNVVMGLIGTLEGPARSSSPAYAVIKQWAPVSTWSLAQLLIGSILLAGVALRPHLRADVGQLIQSSAAGLGAIWCTAWAIPLLTVAISDTHVSYRGSALWFFWGVIPHLFLCFGREG